MKITLKNIGALKQAEFTLGELTLICGENNTGKTYATYALFGFLESWRDFFSLEIAPEKIAELFAEGVTYIDLSSYINHAATFTAQACEKYKNELPAVFAAPADRFKESVFTIDLIVQPQKLEKFERKMRAENTELFSITKQENSLNMVVSFLVEKDKIKIPKNVITSVIESALKDIIFSRNFPNPFIASAERTGAAIFRKELNFARNRLLEEMSQAGKNINPLDLLFNVYQDYALPVKRNVDFTRQLESVAKKNSFILDKHPDILTNFAAIIGGNYTVTRNDELYYIPKNKKIKLTMEESSSAVRSLLDIGFYLRHVAQRGDLLIVDEPELNLHPENQRHLARLFARLVNVGIKVFITTHSDYIIKELNTLIMLNNDKPHLKRIAEKENYLPDELLSAEKIKVYIAEEALIMVDGNRKKTKCQTLTQADISQELGIEIPSFDKTIETMNRIQEEIVWGE
jgi:hypothetical protein